MAIEGGQVGADGCAGGAAGDFISQGILIQITHADGDQHALANQGHDLGGRADDGRLAVAAHTDHKALGLRQDLVDVAVAVVVGSHRDGVVSTVTITWGEVDNASGCGCTCSAVLRIGGKWGQARDSEGDGVAIYVGGCNRNIKRSALVQGGCADVTDLRGTVGIGYNNR